jgi:hypothetical protein
MGGAEGLLLGGGRGAKGRGGGPPACRQIDQGHRGYLLLLLLGGARENERRRGQRRDRGWFLLGQSFFIAWSTGFQDNAGWTTYDACSVLIRFFRRTKRFFYVPRFYDHHVLKPYY